MFGSKKQIIAPKTGDEGNIIQISELVSIDKKTEVSVPSQYKAIAFIEGNPTFRIETCVSKNIVASYGKEYLGKKMKVAFFVEKTFAQTAWGFGNIQVNNERLKEAYRAGANGKFGIEITDYAKTISAFPDCNIITIDQIREKSIAVLQTVGIPILADYFSNTATSVFEISAYVSDFRDKYIKALQEEKLFSQIGIKISSLTVNGFHVNEEDLEIIRNRINK